MKPKLKLITFRDNFDDLQFKAIEEAIKLECKQRRQQGLGKRAKYLWANIYNMKDNKESK
mgnify:CR=1 FL=1|tara:strand:- start:947 stop:1126 length:180 start_codon:yes stop_codon:yes gene_type:complete